MQEHGYLNFAYEMLRTSYLGGVLIPSAIDTSENIKQMMEMSD